MIAWTGPESLDLVREPQTRGDHPYGIAALALVLGIFVGLILADHLIYDESPATAEAVTGPSTGVAAPVIRTMDDFNLPRTGR